MIFGEEPQKPTLTKSKSVLASRQTDPRGRLLPRQSRSALTGVREMGTVSTPKGANSNTLDPKVVVKGAESLEAKEKAKEKEKEVEKEKAKAKGVEEETGLNIDRP